MTASTSSTIMLVARSLWLRSSSSSSSAVTGSARSFAKSHKHNAAAACRFFATRRKFFDKPLAPEVMDALPSYFIEGETIEGTTNDSWAFPQNPVTSAHMIDLEAQEPSVLDSAAVTPDGRVVHGRYGDLGETAKAIPLEFLALLRPAADGAAAVRMLHPPQKGTLLVYGATQANGMAAIQLANAAGHAVVAVVDGNHSGNDLMMECVKWMLNEPGTSVAEEYALSKKNFANLVRSIAEGDEQIKTHKPEEYLEDFKQLFVDYSAEYPDTRPAAVSEEELEFVYMEKDREFFDENMAAYLEQFPRGAPPVEKAKLDALFTTEQYEIFRQKFWNQTSAVVAGDDLPFEPPEIVHKQMDTPEKLVDTVYPGAGPEFPYYMNTLRPLFPQGTEIPKGGPIVGAIICVTPQLKKAAELVAAAPTKRAKGEALAFLTINEKAAFHAARCVVAQAGNNPVVVCGGTLPGMTSVNATDADVQTALKAMDIDEEGKSTLNYYVQAFRANNFPFYGDYAVHRASEPLAGPRQIIVTK